MIKSNEDYTRIVTQNEALKEKVEVLFKLGKSYVETNNTCRSCSQTVDNSHRNSNNIPQETIAASLEVNNSSNEVIQTSDVQTNSGEEIWNSNRLRGFKKKNVTINLPTDDSEAMRTAQNPPLSPGTSQRPEATNNNTLENSGKLCYFFTKEPAENVNSFIQLQSREFPFVNKELTAVG